VSKHGTAQFFKSMGLSSSKRSILAMVVTWVINLFWLGVNYFWGLAGLSVLITVPVVLLLIAIIALAAYIYWGIRKVKEQDAPYANIMVGVIIAVTLLYFNFKFLQFILELTS
jgi:hypothetical protein